MSVPVANAVPTPATMEKNAYANNEPQQYVQQPQVVYVQNTQDPRLACRGVQQGGMYTSERYCGPITLIIGIFIFPCICCCPCDEREVYVEPGTGRRVVLSKSL